MIQTLSTKCSAKGCTHGLANPVLLRKDAPKWHQCLYCGKFEVSNWIDRHERQCQSFAQSNQ